VSFKPPNFNLTCNIWRNSAGILTMPPAGPPALANQPCQLRIVWSGCWAGSTLGAPVVLLLLPALTDVRPLQPGGIRADAVECPAGSGRFYSVTGVDDQHKGFPNEYRFATMATNPNRVGYWPVPTP